MRWALRASRTSPPLACVSIAAATPLLSRATVSQAALQHRWAMRQASSSSSMTAAAAR